MTGAEYIAQFLHKMNMDKVFLLTGGACAFMIDAVAKHPGLSYYCVMHEQSAAMAADAIWRTTRNKVGVTMATSGPGATNLITGIACSYFDSIPTLHITGQVNMRESADFIGVNVRQIGFQETNIVDMVRPITKHSVLVRTGEELKRELARCYEIAISGRMGPVLIDVPMDVQQEDVGETVDFVPEVSKNIKIDDDSLGALAVNISEHLAGAERPIILFGAGIGLAGVEVEVCEWLTKSGLPFVASWNATGYFDHDHLGFLGNIGVYGNRGANYALQNCDRLLVLGSRLDNRQRSGTPVNFAPGAKVFVLDVDGEELKKYSTQDYLTSELDFVCLPRLLEHVPFSGIRPVWRDYLIEMKARYFRQDISTFSVANNTMSPYHAVQRISDLVDHDAIVVVDTGAALCWVYQAFHHKQQTLFSDGGNSAMGYSLTASIGASVADTDRQLICFSGDGGFQTNIQELQTIIHYDLDITIIILNNCGYGIIKQFQDSYMDSRYEATGIGYSQPSMQAIVEAYGLKYHRVDKLQDIRADLFQQRGATVIDIILDENTLIEPKLEMGRPINDQFPYADEGEFEKGNRFVHFTRK